MYFYAAGKVEKPTEANTSTKWFLGVSDAKDLLITKNTGKCTKGLSTTMVATNKKSVGPLIGDRPQTKSQSYLLGR